MGVFICVFCFWKCLSFNRCVIFNNVRVCIESNFSNENQNDSHVNLKNNCNFVRK